MRLLEITRPILHSGSLRSFEQNLLTTKDWGLLAAFLILVAIFLVIFAYWDKRDVRLDAGPFKVKRIEHLGYVPNWIYTDRGTGSVYMVILADDSVMWTVLFHGNGNPFHTKLSKTAPPGIEEERPSDFPESLQLIK